MTGDQGARFLDVVQDPRQALVRLSVKNASATKGFIDPVNLSDDGARRRIRECAVARGLAQRGVDEIARCAGVSLSGEREVLSCLSGKRCFPRLSAKAPLNILAEERINPNLPSSNNMFPRSQLNLRNAVAKLNNCDTSNTSFDECVRVAMLGSIEGVSENEESVQLIDCVFRNPEDSTECFNSLGTNSALWGKIRDCDGNFKPSIQCFANNSLLDSLPNQYVNALNCLGQDENSNIGMQPSGTNLSGSTRVVDCLAGLEGDNELQAKVACIDNVSGTADNIDKVAIAKCLARGVVDDKVLKFAETAQSCWSRESNDAYAATACLAIGNVEDNGDGMKVAKCVAESGSYDYTTIATCAIAPQMNPEWQIAMRCAQVSGGVPATFATCAGGELLKKELTQCRGASFAVDPCFGENNEIRKTLASVGIEIGPNSVVAKSADVVIDAYEFLEFVLAGDDKDHTGNLAAAAIDRNLRLIEQIVTPFGIGGAVSSVARSDLNPANWRIW